jgi:DNA-binding NarL/FixJ family response regulator
VKTHVSRVPAKLELRSRVQAAVLAQELGIPSRFSRVVQTY